MSATTDPVIPTIEDVRGRLVDMQNAHPEIIRLEVFGSVARREAHEASDVDLVATFTPKLKETVRGLNFFGYLDDLEADLAEKLGRPVHVIDQAAVANSEHAGNRSLARAVARDAQLVYETNGSPEGGAEPHR